MLKLGQIRTIERDLDDLIQLAVCQLASVYLKTRRFAFTRRYIRRQIWLSISNLYGKFTRPHGRIFRRTYLVSGDVLDGSYKRDPDYSDLSATLTTQIQRQQWAAWANDTTVQDIREQTAKEEPATPRKNAATYRSLSFRISKELSSQVVALASQKNVATTRLVTALVEQGLTYALANTDSIDLLWAGRAGNRAKGGKGPTVGLRLHDDQMAQLATVAQRVCNTKQFGAKSELLRWLLARGLELEQTKGP